MELLKLTVFFFFISCVSANCCLRYSQNQRGIYCQLPIPCLGGTNFQQPSPNWPMSSGYPGGYPGYPNSPGYPGYPTQWNPDLGGGWGVSNIPPGYPGNFPGLPGYPGGYPGYYRSGNWGTGKNQVFIFHLYFKILFK